MFDFTTADQSFSDAENFLKQEYLQISTGRANPALLDSVNVESYGSFQPVKNIASITLEDARTMKVSPWDKGQIKDIERAIVDSQLPFSLSVDDTGVRVHVPQMTEESKKKIIEEKGIPEVRVEDIIIKAPNNGDFNRMKYFINISPKSGGTDFKFWYKMDGTLDKFDY